MVLLLVSLAAFSYFEQFRNADELPRLIQAMSLVEQGQWAIDTPSRRGLPLGPDVALSLDGPMLVVVGAAWSRPRQRVGAGP